MRACSSSRKVASIASFPRRQESKNVFRNLWKGFLWSLDIGGRLSLSRKHLFLHYGSNLDRNFINGSDKLETTGIFPECRCLSERRRYVSTLVVFSQVLQISKKKKKLVVRWTRVTQEPRKASILDWEYFLGSEVSCPTEVLHREEVGRGLVRLPVGLPKLGRRLLDF